MTLARAINAQISTGDVKTTGKCSPVVIQPKDGFEIVCHDRTLTRTEALRQAKQISELLSKLRATSQDNREVIKKLDSILQQLNEMNTAVAETNTKIALAGAPIHTIPVINGVAMPDLSYGLTQRVLLQSDVVITAPRLPHMGKDETIVWTLFVDEDELGNHKYKMEFLEEKTTWPGLIGNSRGSYEFISESTGATMMRAVPIVNILKPKESTEK